MDFELIESKWKSVTAPLIVDVQVKFKVSLKVSAVWSWDGRVASETGVNTECQILD